MVQLKSLATQVRDLAVVPRRAPHGGRAWLAIALMFGLLLVIQVIVFVARGDPTRIAWDFNLYIEAAAEWFDGGHFYEPWQLTGPYEVLPRGGAILYPPTLIPLLMPFLVLPGLLWWVVPIGGVLAIVWSHRPGPIAIAWIALCVAFPATPVKVIAGNPVMWAVLGVALATRWPTGVALTLLKPSLIPFAVMGFPRRGWWVGVLVTVAALLVALPLTIEWLTAVANAQTGGGLLYSLQEVPMMAIPVIAWLDTFTIERRSGVPVPLR